MKALLLGGCLLLAACSGDSEPKTREAPATSAAPDYPCPNQEAVLEDVSLRTGNPGTGDVDGDGEDEDVAVYYDPEAEVGCQGFVVAKSDAGTLSAPLETWRGEFGLPMPTLNALVDLDGEPGDEVVVNMGAGASTQFVGVVVADGGMLRQVTTDLASGSGVAPGMLGFGGSVGHMEAVDCAPDGGVIASFATPDDDVYRVERTVYGFAGAELIEESRKVERVRAEQVTDLPEYAASPFGSCS